MKKIMFFFIVLVLFPLGLMAQHEVGIVAHRGFHKAEGSAQNSIFGLQLAVDNDFEGSEFDVQLTQDGVALVFHDNTLQEHLIAATPFDTLKMQPAFVLKNGENVPLMGDFLAACSKALEEQKLREKHTILFFEIKPQTTQEARYWLVGQILEAMGAYQLHDDIFFISFDLETCALLAQMVPDIPVAYLEGDLAPEALHAKGIDGIDYHWKTLLEHPEWVEEAHRLGMSVNAWTVNQAETAKEMRDLGVDYITTDYPLEMRTWLEQ